MREKPIIHHIPVCPFCQRVEILLELKGLRDRVDFGVVDITVPRPEWLVQKLGDTTSLPILETTEGLVIKESLVILRYLDELYPEVAIARATPYERAVENMLIAMEGPFGMAGYRFIMNQDRARRDGLRDELLALYLRLDRFLSRHAPESPFLFERFGLAEAVYTPLFMRFWFLDYYEGFELPAEPEYARVRQWRDACLAHPAAQQVSYEQIVKLYYDYALGAGNGALLEGRARSSFVFEPDWRVRPMPPREKYGPSASDAELGLTRG
jgi:glutathione S-transferase